MRKKRILILGAKGNLGGQLILLFNEDDYYEVIGWDKEDIDITDKELILKKISDIKPNAIINAVGYNAVDKCEIKVPNISAEIVKERGVEYEKAKKLNGDAVGFLADCALNNNSLFIHFSTDNVFGKEENTKKEFQEDDAPNPVNSYGETKLMGEKEIISRSGKGLKWYLIRVSRLFGPKGSSELAKPNFFDIMINLSKDKNELKAINEEVSCFTYTPDLAKAVKNIVDLHFKTRKNKLGYGIYHITNSDGTTWYEAAKELFKIINENKNLNESIKIVPVSASSFPRPAKRPKFSILINTKLPQLRNYKDALKEYINKISNF